MSDQLSGELHPLVSGLVRDLGWDLTPIQQESMPGLLRGGHRLLLAPTGSGKTEAAILPLASRALSEEWQGLSILYVTPLRALNRDIDRRLGAMLEPLGLSVGLRHGDTSQSERTRQSRSPPNLLVTTPETLQIMLLGSRLRLHLAGVRAIVIDEVHDLAASERGSQLLVGISRVEEYCKEQIQRVGLSATVGNPNEMARWMHGDAEPVHGPAPRTTKIEVHRERILPEDEVMSVEWSISPSSVAAFRSLSQTLLEDYPSLVFVNSRSAAETVAQRLSRLSPELTIGVHHGSLAAETRREMENSLRAGNLHALICTSSLELGIDIGTIRRVHQIQSPRAVDRMLQRLGRAEHHMGGTGRGRVLAWDADGISEAAVIARRAMEGEIEGVEWRTNPGIVVSNQLLQMSIERGVVPLDLATEIFMKCSILSDWSHESTLALLRVLDERWLLRLIENPAESDVTTWSSKLWAELASRSKGEAPAERPSWEEEVSDSDKEKWRRQLLQALPESLKKGWISPAGRLGKTRGDHFSMIPDEMSYRVRDAVTRRVLGSVDEAFVLSLGDGSSESFGRARRFVMAGRTWEIIDADPEQEELLVAPVKESGEAPIWAGELPPVPREVAEEVGRLRRSAAIEIGVLPDENECLPFSSYPLSEIAAETIVSSVAEHLDATGVLPDNRTMTVEDRDGTIVLNTCCGSKINETLAHFIQAMGSMLQGKMGRALVDPYRISFQVPGMTASNVIEWLQETPSNALPSILRMTIPNGLAVRWRVVQVARRMGVLAKGVDPRKVNLEGLMERYRGTPVIEESLDKLFHERMDIDATVDVMREIQNGAVEVSHTATGPLGMSPKGERDLLLPSWSDNELRERLEIRLVNERAVLICLNCQSKRRGRVGRMEERIEDCSSCGGRMLACAPERMEAMLADWVSSRDPTIRGKMEKNAELVRNHGVEAVICLMGRGIAEETATRIMRGHVKGERIKLLRSIHNAELKYARTRRYWS